MKTGTRILLWVLGTVLGLIICLVTGLHFYVGTEHAQQVILAEINKSIPGSLSFRQLHISFLNARLKIIDGVLKDPEGKQVVRADDLAVNLSWLSLLKKKVVVENATITKPVVDLGLDREGRYRVVHALYRADKDESSTRDQGTGFVRNVVVEHLSIKDGAVHYENGDGSVHAELSGVELAADGDLAARRLNFTGQLSQAAYTGKGTDARLQEFFAETSLRKDVFDPLTVRAETGFSHIGVRGSISRVFDKPVFDLSAEVEISLPEVKKTFGLSGEFTGALTAGIAVKGSLDDPGIRTTLTYGGGILGAMQVDGAQIDLGFERKILCVEDARIQLASGNMAVKGHADLNKAFPQGFLTDKPDLEAISYAFSAKGSGIDLAELVTPKTSIQGVVDPDITVAGTGITLYTIRAQISAGLTCRKLVTGEGVPPFDVRLKSSARIKDGVMRVESLDAVSGTARLTGEGWIDLASRELDVNMDLDMSSLTRAVKPFGIDAGGSAGLAVRVSKTLDSPQVVADIHGQQIRYGQIFLGDITCTAGMSRSGVVNINRFALENKGSEINGYGSARIFKEFPEFMKNPAVSFTADLSNVELKDFMQGKDISGTWKGSVDLGGAIFFPDATLVLEGSGVSANGVQAGNVQVQCTLEKGILKVDRVAARNGDSLLEAAGSMVIFDPDTKAFIRDPSIILTFNGSDIHLQDVYPGYAGRVSVAANIEGTVRHSRGELSLTGEEIDLGFQKVHKVVLASRIDGERFVVDMLRVSLREGETMEGEGWVSLNRDYSFHLWGEGLSLKSNDALERNYAIRGRIALDLSGQGSMDNPRLKGSAVISGLFMQENTPSGMVVRLDLENRELRMTGEMDFAFHGSYHLDTKDYFLLADFDDTDISPYLVFLGRPDLKGSVDGRIEIRRNVQDKGNIQASMDLTHLDIFFRDSEIVRSDNLRASLAGKELSIPETRIMLGQRGWVDISGAGDLGRDVVVSASGDVPLDVVQPFIGDIEDIQGQLTFTARVVNSAKGMDVRSDITLEDIVMKVPYVEEQLQETSGHITITQEMVLFENIRGKLGQGTFNLAGKAELEDMIPQRIGFRFNAKSLPVNMPDTMDLSADMDLTLEGTQDQTLLQGKAVLVDGTYYRDIKVDLIRSLRTAIERKPSVKARRGEITTPFVKNMGLDVSVRRRGSLYVDNNIAQMDINPDLTITGTLNDPIVNGRVSVVSGTVQFRKRTFTVTKGVIDFLNPYATQAEIDIESQVDIRDWVIYLTISGSPDALKLSLESDPEEEDNDILSLLVLGKTSSELMSGTGGNTESTSAMIAALVASRYTHGFKEATGLDIVEIESGTGTDEDSDAIKVTIGKELSRRITLKYAMESKNSELSQRAVAEYKMFENIVLNGFQDTRGIFGADVQLRLEFR